jgi:hypothetical protein
MASWLYDPSSPRVGMGDWLRGSEMIEVLVGRQGWLSGMGAARAGPQVSWIAA